MANIAEDLAKIISSRYGKDVRQAIHDSIYDINEIAESQLSNIEADMNTATTAANTAVTSATNAAASENTASTAATTATIAASEASTSANTATNAATTATSAASVASTAATNASSSETNAKMWSDRAVDAASSISGGLIPRGSITFSELPTIEDSSIGDMYIITDSFTSTVYFEDGGGVSYNAGTKIYLTGNYKWDIEPSSIIAPIDLLLTIEEL